MAMSCTLQPPASRRVPVWEGTVADPPDVDIGTRPRSPDRGGSGLGTPVMIVLCTVHDDHEQELWTQFGQGCAHRLGS